MIFFLKEMNLHTRFNRKRYNRVSELAADGSGPFILPEQCLEKEVFSFCWLDNLQMSVPQL